ncbi:hypothetical protein C815_00825 [Firmicutes bacterium M10-2]|nr:hypothetical protein C815_00825 [Firmicutes bacterium M10-2]
MNKTSSQIRQDMIKFYGPKWDEFPSVDLYMDQIVEYINTSLQKLGMKNETKFITKSMVNNYVKNSVLIPPIKKRYNKNHIGYLIVVCLLKQCFSLAEISEMIEIYRNLKDKKIQMHYNHFMVSFETCLHEVFEKEQISFQLYKDPTKEQALMESAIKTVVYKLYTQYLLRSSSEK